MGQCFDMMQFKELTYDSCKDVVEGDANDGESLLNGGGNVVGVSVGMD